MGGARARAGEVVIAMLPCPTCGHHAIPDAASSPYLNEPARSAERAALDLAVIELIAHERVNRDIGSARVADHLRQTLDKIAALVPEAVK